MVCFQDLATELETDCMQLGSLQEEASLMHHVMSQLRRNQDERSLTAGQKWTLPPCGQPICLFNGSNEGRRVMRATDDSEFIFEASRTAFRADSFSYIVWVQFIGHVTNLCHRKVQERLSLCLP